MTEPQPKQSISFFASLELAITLMALTALTVLIGAWCPQESQVGREKVFETFGPDLGQTLIQFGVSDIFHSPWFLFLIAMLTMNMLAVSFQRVFPKVKLLKHVMPFIEGRAIEKMPVARKVVLPEKTSSAMTMSFIVNELAKRRFNVKVNGNAMTAEYGKYGRLAATVTHIGLLTLLAGVTVTSWTGFSGFQPVRMKETMSLAKSDHSKLWIGKLPSWSVRVDDTRRENYESGDPKQWYSNLSVLDAKGNVLKQGEISVNNPLSYDGVDIYQSSWGLDVVDLSFNGHVQRMPLQPMGKRYAAFMPLDGSTVLIFSLLDTKSPMRVFAKRADWEAPKLVAEVKPQGLAKLGSVEVKYVQVLPVSGLQYKCDPGLPIVYTAFAFIMAGVMLAAIPHRHVWACVEEDVPLKEETQVDSGSGNEPAEPIARGTILYIGGKSLKAKVGFERLIDKLVESVNELAGVPKSGTVEAVDAAQSVQAAQELETVQAAEAVAVSAEENANKESELVTAGADAHSGDS